MRQRILLLTLLALLCTVPVHAFSTKYPFVSADCTVTVAPAGLQTEITNRNTGVVCVTSGSLGSFTMSGTSKDIVVAGPPAWGGSGTLTVTSFVMKATGSPWLGGRVTGITFASGGAQNTIEAMEGFRFDHNIIGGTPGSFCLLTVGSTAVGGRSVHPQSEGVIDHNTMTQCRIVGYGEYTGGGGTNGFDRWSEPLNLGTVHCVYIEDNDWTNTQAGLFNMADDNLGGNYCARFNQGHNTYVEAHSIQGGNSRAQRKVEIYNNHFDNTGTTDHRTGFFRGGVGMVFNNNYTGAWGGNGDFDFDNVRTGLNGHQLTDFDPWGECLGVGSPGQVQVADGNLDSSGYPCRDQVGVSGDAFFWTSHPTAPGPPQSMQPWLVWSNTAPGFADMTWDWNGVDNPTQLRQQIKGNRNIFASSASPSSAPIAVNCFGFGTTCTSGIGVGALANRPNTCTPIADPIIGTTSTGPYYWATDDGEWNSTHAGNDGRMYKCALTNTWVIYYTPYTYPHPLVAPSSGDITPPSAPTNLRIVAPVGTKNITVAWDASTDDTAVTGYLVEHSVSGCGSGFSQIGTPAGLSFNDTGLLTVTSYCFRVRATDAASNLSSYSSTLSQMTDSVKFHPTLNMRRVSADEVTSIFNTYFGGHDEQIYY